MAFCKSGAMAFKEGPRRRARPSRADVEVEVRVPKDFVGAVTGDLSPRRKDPGHGRGGPLRLIGPRCRAELRKYSTHLRSSRGTRNAPREALTLRRGPRAADKIIAQAKADRGNGPGLGGARRGPTTCDASRPTLPCCSRLAPPQGARRLASPRRAPRPLRRARIQRRRFSDRSIARLSAEGRCFGVSSPTRRSGTPLRPRAPDAGGRFTVSADAPREGEGRTGRVRLLRSPRRVRLRRGGRTRAPRAPRVAVAERNVRDRGRDAGAPSRPCRS